jgi:HEPN domain-containing protein
MNNLFDTKDYPWALFMGHLLIEKLLKACYVQRVGTDIPFVHDLLRLSDKAGLVVDSVKMDMLDEISTFNIKARYDDYKRTFKKLCTRDFAVEKIKIVNEIREWLKKELNN